MGGVTKADIDLGGRRLLDHVAQRLEPQVRSLAVNANGPLASDWPVVADADEVFLGPLAGILAGLQWAEAQGATHMVSAAVDTPFFPCDLVPQLLLAGETHAQGLAVAATRDGQHGTFGIWPVTLNDDLAKFVAGGGRKVRDWTARHKAALAMFPDTTPPSFFNINTPDDLGRAQAWL